MNGIQLKKSDLELDLAFCSTPWQMLPGFIDTATRLRLTQADPWVEDLKTWISTIRVDKTLQCPELVRRSSNLSMGLQLTDDQTIKKMNSLWRDKSEVTDVLSFPVIDENALFPEGACVELGDIVVSVPTAHRQAKQQNHLLLIELRWLVSHGLLHLLGWDHPSPQSLQKMLSCQEELLQNTSKVQSPGDYPSDH